MYSVATVCIWQTSIIVKSPSSQCKLLESIILQQHMHVYRSPSTQQLLQQQHCRCKGIPSVGQHCSFLLQAWVTKLGGILLQTCS